MKKLLISMSAAMACAAIFSSTASAAVVLITQAKAIVGNVTPGDTPGFPVTISLPGSYRLDSNLKVPASRNGIDAISVEVTIDLNGFMIDGGGVAVDGIKGTQRTLTVRNGTIRAFGNVGINGNGALDMIESMRIEENLRGGVFIAGAGNGFARIVNSVIFGNGGAGIFCARACHIESNLISSNTSTGVNLSNFGGFVVGNTIFGNGAGGVFSSFYNAVSNNMISSNSGLEIGGSFVSLGNNLCDATKC